MEFHPSALLYRVVRRNLEKARIRFRALNVRQLKYAVAHHRIAVFYQNVSLQVV